MGTQVMPSPARGKTCLPSLQSKMGLCYAHPCWWALISKGILVISIQSAPCAFAAQTSRERQKPPTLHGANTPNRIVGIAGELHKKLVYIPTQQRPIKSLKQPFPQGTTSNTDFAKFAEKILAGGDKIG